MQGYPPREPPVNQSKIAVVVRFTRSAAFKERQKGFSCYSSGSDEIEDDVHTDFIVTRNN